MLQITNELKESGLLAGIVSADGVCIETSPPELEEILAALTAERKEVLFPPDELKSAVRKLLRKGGFKPSGRNKPASEYLAQAAREDRFPYINNLVDINNYISLYSGLPSSLLDRGKTGDQIRLRLGSESERYIFNNTGQEIDLKGLICLCRDDTAPGTPYGNPVKDSMLGKLSNTTSSVIGIVYAPMDYIERDALEEFLQIFAELLQRFGHASTTETLVV